MITVQNEQSRFSIVTKKMEICNLLPCKVWQFCSYLLSTVKLPLGNRLYILLWEGGVVLWIDWCECQSLILRPSVQYTVWEWDSTPTCKRYIHVNTRMCANNRMAVAIIVWVEDKISCILPVMVNSNWPTGGQRKLITSCLEVLHVSSSQLELRCTTTSSNLA